MKVLVTGGTGFLGANLVGRFARHYSSARAIRELGYPQTPLRATLEKTYRWYVENGYLESRR